MVSYLSRLCGGGEVIQKEILTLQEVAKYLRVNPRTIHRMIDAKKIPCFRVGNRYRFLKSILIQWVQDKAGKGARPCIHQDSKN